MHGDRRVGVHLKFLEWTKDRMVAFTYYDPGLILERHAHESDALVFVIEGDVEVGGHPCPPGTLIVLEKGAAVRPADRRARRLHLPRVLRRRRAAGARRQGRLLQAPRRARDRAAAEPRVGGAARCPRARARRRGQLVLTQVQRAGTPRIVDRVNRRLVIATGLSSWCCCSPALLLGGRARPQRRRPLRRRCLRLAVPHAVREQLAVQAEEPVRVRVVLDRAGRRGEPRRRSATATIASRFVATVIKQGAGMGTYKGIGSHPRSADGARRGSRSSASCGPARSRTARDRDPRRPRDRTPRREGRHLHPRQPEQRRRPRSRAGLERVSTVIVLADELERRATSPTTSTPARCSRPSRSRSINPPRTRASR